MNIKRFWAASSAAVLLAALAGCSASQPPAPATNEEGLSEDSLSGELTIYAAASLKDAFDAAAADFSQAHPNLTINPITYDGSHTLAVQIVAGAPADVFASADEPNMLQVSEAGLSVEPVIFATNTLVLIVPAGNPGNITGLADLGNDALDVILCNIEVPCGNAANRLLQEAGVGASVDSYEQNVTAVLTKVAGNEADAGMVYLTDATANPRVEIIEVPGTADIVNRYPITALTDSTNPAAAQAFVEFVLSPSGAQHLTVRGFGDG